MWSQNNLTFSWNFQADGDQFKKDPVCNAVLCMAKG